MQLANPWTVLHKEEIFSCPYFSIRSDLVTHLGGLPIAYHSIRTKLFGVTVIPIDEQGFTTLVGQYRYVLDGFFWELPGGGARYDRPSVNSAKQELLEETGYQADQWLQILDACVAPGTSDDLSRAFVAWGLHAGAPQPEVEEQLVCRRVHFQDAIAMITRAEIKHLGSIAALFSLHAKLVRSELPADLASRLT